MVWFIIAVVVVAAVAFVAFRATGRQPLEEPDADEHQDSRDRMI